LVEGWLLPTLVAATDWGEAEVVLHHFLADKPPQHLESLASDALFPGRRGHSESSFGQ
jgi:hypothetical protein